MKENNTGQTVYEQLQEFLNECVKLGMKPYGMEGIISFGNHRMGETSFCYKNEEFGIIWVDRDYHSLFSKDSGLMEFVEWDSNIPYNAVVLGSDGFYESLGWSPYHEMSMLTAEEKIKYLLKNAKLPTKSE